MSYTCSTVLPGKLQVQVLSPGFSRPLSSYRTSSYRIPSYRISSHCISSQCPRVDSSHVHSPHPCRLHPEKGRRLCSLKGNLTLLHDRNLVIIIQKGMIKSVQPRDPIFPASISASSFQRQAIPFASSCSLALSLPSLSPRSLPLPLPSAVWLFPDTAPVDAAGATDAR
jgi:hypothetical protein